MSCGTTQIQRRIVQSFGETVFDPLRMKKFNAQRDSQRHA